MLYSAAAVRTAFDELGQQYIELSMSLTPAQLELAGLGQWSVRQLLGHAIRAFSTAAANLDATPTVEFAVHTPGDYYRAAFSSGPTIHAEIAERGVHAGIALGPDVAATVSSTVTKARARIRAADDDDIVNHFTGRIPFVAYLATRVVEAGVHLLDLQRALGLPVAIDPGSAAIVLLTLASTGDVNQMILALTGRGDLPAGFNVLQ